MHGYQIDAKKDNGKNEIFAKNRWANSKFRMLRRQLTLLLVRATAQMRLNLTKTYRKSQHEISCICDNGQPIRKTRSQNVNVESNRNTPQMYLLRQRFSNDWFGKQA